MLMVSFYFVQTRNRLTSPPYDNIALTNKYDIYMLLIVENIIDSKLKTFTHT